MFEYKAIMTSSKKRETLVAAIGTAVQSFQDATDMFDEAAALRLGINRTDLRCLGVVAAQGPIAVGEVGKAIELTRGATTTALDRVERAGYVRRVRHPQDRRGVLIEITQKGLDAAGAIWAPLVAAGERMLAAFEEGELQTILRFLEEARALQHRASAPAGEGG